MRTGCLPVLAVVIFGVLAAAGTVSAADISAAIGDRVPLSGSAIGTDTIYLFVTGPGLAPNGVKPDNMRSEVVTGDPSTFTVTDVTSDRWAFSWNTARQGFSLKEGIYTVYAAKQPAGKDGISGVTYGTIEVSLTRGGEPYRSTGTVAIDSTPPSLITINGQTKGVTPQTLTLPIGAYTLRLERDGYEPVTESVTVTGGSFAEVRKSLVPAGGATTVATTLPGTLAYPTIVTPAETATRSLTIPVTTGSPDPLAGAFAAMAVASLFIRKIRV